MYTHFTHTLGNKVINFPISTAYLFLSQLCVCMVASDVGALESHVLVVLSLLWVYADLKWIWIWRLDGT